MHRLRFEFCILFFLVLPQDMPQSLCLALEEAEFAPSTNTTSFSHHTAKMRIHHVLGTSSEDIIKIQDRPIMVSVQANKVVSMLHFALEPVIMMNIFIENLKSNHISAEYSDVQRIWKTPSSNYQLKLQ